MGAFPHGTVVTATLLALGQALRTIDGHVQDYITEARRPPENSAQTVLRLRRRRLRGLFTVGPCRWDR